MRWQLCVMKACANKRWRKLGVQLEKKRITSHNKCYNLKLVEAIIVFRQQLEREWIFDSFAQSAMMETAAAKNNRIQFLAGFKIWLSEKILSFNWFHITWFRYGQLLLSSSDPGISGVRFMGLSHWQSWDLTVVTLADDDIINSILTDCGNSGQHGNAIGATWWPNCLTF